MEELTFYITVIILCINMYYTIASTVSADIKKNKIMCERLRLDTLFSHKQKMDERLQTSLLSLHKNKEISERTKKHRVLVLNIMQREMNDSEKLFYESIGNMKTLLKGNYESMLQLKQTSKKRLDQLQNAMVQAEDEYSMIMEEERKENLENKLHKTFTKNRKETVIKDYINNLFAGISAAAESLQSKLKDDSFEQEIHSKDHKIAIDTVIKVGGTESQGIDDNEGVVMLIDSESNHFVLSKSKDSTVTHVDHVLLRDIMSVIMLAFFFMLLCNLLQLPSIFAAILAGVLLGPAGTGYTKSIVQIETIGEFGVFFFLFTVGMELSPEKLAKVLRQSLIGTVSILICSIIIGLFWGRVFGILPRQSVFVALCLSFCSTPMMTNIIESYSAKDDSVGSHQVGDDYMNLLKSMLVLQDIVLGMFMAAIPILAGHSTEKSHSFAYVPGGAGFHSWFHGAFGGPAEELFFTIFEFVFAISGILFLTFVISRYAAGKYFRGLNLFGCHNQSFVLGILSAIFGIVTITEMVGISMELGGFICGTICGSMGEQTIKQVSQIIQPFKDFFSVLFFASIGFHVFPSFVLSEIAIFIPVTALVILTKFSVVAGILHQLLPKGNKSKWLVAIGLSQMSELSFVLGSRARRNGLIGREVYLVILSVTTLSLLVSPFMWRTVHSSVMQSGKWNIQGIVQKLRSIPISN